MKYIFLIFLLGTQAFASVNIDGWNNLLVKISLVDEKEDLETAMGISKSLSQSVTQGNTQINSYVAAMGTYSSARIYQVQKVALTEESTTLIDGVWNITSDTYVLSPDGELQFASSNTIQKDSSGGVLKYEVNELDLPLSESENQKFNLYLEKWFN